VEHGRVAVADEEFRRRLAQPAGDAEQSVAAAGEDDRFRVALERGFQLGQRRASSPARWPDLVKMASPKRGARPMSRSACTPRRKRSRSKALEGATTSTGSPARSGSGLRTPAV
jgi:hypothetical protein